MFIYQMAYKILRTYLSSDIVDHCVLPYLFVSEKEVKSIYQDVLQDFKLEADVAYIYDFFDEGECYPKSILTILRDDKKVKKNKLILSKNSFAQKLNI